MSTTDIVIIGSGIGGATIASALAGKNAKVVILERGDFLRPVPQAKDPVSIFQQGYYRNSEEWYDTKGQAYQAGNYYYVGGNSKFYGAAMVRYRKEDFAELTHADGISPAWPFPYEELEPYYCQAEQLFRVRGPNDKDGNNYATAEDPTEPYHSQPYSYPQLADEPDIARVKEKLKQLGLHPHSVPLAIDLDAWLKEGKTTWDAYPNPKRGKIDAETGPLELALKDQNIQLITRARVTKLLTNEQGKMIDQVEYLINGRREKLRAKLIILAAGAVQSAALLLRSANSKNPKGLANSSGNLGKNLMNHNTSAILAIDPRRPNRAIYQKTLALNDFYLTDGSVPRPLGCIQLLGKVTGPILKGFVPTIPKYIANLIGRYSMDWYIMSEDLPKPTSRVELDGSHLVVDWQPANQAAHGRLVKLFCARLRSIGYPIVLSRPFDRRVPSHQCGTARFGKDSAHSVLDPYCNSYDHPNLYIVDASFLPNSAAVNPALTIAAQALRVGDHLKETFFR